MRLAKKVVLQVLGSAALVAGLWACDKGGPTPGERLDRALDRTGEKVKEAGDAIKPR